MPPEGVIQERAADGPVDLGRVRASEQVDAAEVTAYKLILAAELPEQREQLLGPPNPLVDALVARVLTARKQLLEAAQVSEGRAATIQNLEQVAATDPLTGLPNRRYLEMSLEQLEAGYFRRLRNLEQAGEITVEQVRRLMASPYAALLLDIDDFKRINDTYGHQAGDQVLVEVARRLRVNVRGEDIVARYGGDELIVIAMEINGGATILAETLRRVIADQPFTVTGNHLGQRMIRVTVSIGVGPHDRERNVMLTRADEALYAAKQGGKNQAWAFDNDSGGLAKCLGRIRTPTPGRGI